MASKKKTWKEKLSGAKPAHVTVLEKAFGGVPAGARLAISSPADIAKLLTKSKPGETLSIPDLRSKIAAQMKADAACPVTTSMFLRIVAEAALEDLEAGAPADKVTPFWRAIDPNTPLAAKLSCGAAGLARLRKSDGIV
ncbi:MAG: hypothetical protein ACOYJ6_13470 [Caulobacterales bacterium]|jgi:hypothetical protein